MLLSAIWNCKIFFIFLIVCVTSFIIMGEIMLKNILGKEVLFFDGGTGTVLQEMGLILANAASAWQNARWPMAAS